MAKRKLAIKISKNPSESKVNQTTSKSTQCNRKTNEKNMKTIQTEGNSCTEESPCEVNEVLF